MMNRFDCRGCLSAVLRAFSAVLVLAATFAAARAADEPSSANSTGVRIVRNLAYRDLLSGEDAADERNKLDLYLPRDQKDYPVIFFVHGGAWRQGSKDFMGIYAAFGLYWAHHGVGVVVPNYRLSPGVQHPAHINDVAKALAWTYRNIGKYGGRADAIFVSGHSAGGHLSALLATDDRYLKGEGLSLAAIRGAIPISGVYRIYGQYLDASVTADGTGRSPARFNSVFTSDPKVRKDASPLSHARPGLPPFLIIYADHDLPTLPAMAEEFGATLNKSKCDVRVLAVKKRNHMTVFLDASRDGDPAEQAISDFIAKHVARPTSSPK
jgi:acetyl esterase/lipase